MAMIHNRAGWNALPEQEATAIIHNLVETQLPEFTIKSFERFNKFNQHSFTAVLDYQGREFVFVPGDTVVLGLDKEGQSPLRTVTIAPMIAERYVQETGYFPVSLDDERLTDDPYFAKTFAELSTSPKEKYTHTVNDSFRLEKNGTVIKAFLYQSASYDELIQEVSNSGFRLPDEDEWEYLCGGGSRSLFPWGDQLDLQKKYHHFAADRDKDEPYYLDIPNHFGIVIANNPYHYEVVMDSQWFLKSGDGGCNICGGEGLEMGYLPVSTYYRDANIFDEEMNYKEEITGDYTFIRRIKRLVF